MRARRNTEADYDSVEEKNPVNTEKIEDAIRRKPFINDNNFIFNWQIIFSVFAVSIIALGVFLSFHQDVTEYQNVSELKLGHIINNISVISVPTTNIQQSMSFYGDLLGLSRVESFDQTSSHPIYHAPYLQNSEINVPIKNDSIVKTIHYRAGNLLIQLVSVPDVDDTLLFAPSFSLSLPRHNFGFRSRPNSESESNSARKFLILAHTALRNSYINLTSSGILNKEEVYCEMFVSSLSDLNTKPKSKSSSKRSRDFAPPDIVVGEWIDIASDRADIPSLTAKDRKSPTPTPFITRALGWLVRGVGNVSELVYSLISGSFFQQFEGSSDNQKLENDKFENSVSPAYQAWCKGPSGEWVGVRQETGLGETAIEGVDWESLSRDNRAMALRVAGQNTLNA